MYDKTMCGSMVSFHACASRPILNSILNNAKLHPAMSKADLKAFIDHKPVDPQVKNYTERLQKADRLLFIFPIWWGIMPATTKGFIDRVLSPGIAYDHHRHGFGLVPLLKHLNSITIITTMNKPRIMYTKLIGNLIRKVMLKIVFKTMGYKNLEWISFTSVKSVIQQKRIKWLTNLKDRFSKIK